MTKTELNTVDTACYMAERVGDEIAKVPRRELREVLNRLGSVEAYATDLEATVKALKAEVGK